MGLIPFEFADKERYTDKKSLLLNYLDSMMSTRHTMFKIGNLI